MARIWEGGWGTKTARVAIGDEQVLVTSDCGPRGQPVGAAITLEEFLAGRYHQVVRQVFGDEVLEEMVSLVSSLVENSVD